MRKRVWLAVGWGASLALACGGSASQVFDRVPDGTAGETSRGGAAGAAGGVIGVSGSTAHGGMAQGGQSGGGGDSGEAGAGEGGEGGVSSLGPGAWNVTGAMKLLDPNGLHYISCDHLDFTLIVDDHGMTLGRNGEIFQNPVQLASGSYVAQDVFVPHGPACQAAGLLAKVLTLQGVDVDGDGNADQLKGTVNLQANGVIGDIGYTTAYVADLTGVPDTVAPSLLFANGPVNPLATVYPLNGVIIYGSEPLAPTTQLALTGTNAVPLPSGAPGNEGVPGSVIRFSPNQILPLGGQWSIAGSGADRSGHALTPSGEISTSPDPGVQAQDGFEGVLKIGADSSATIVSSVGTIGAISGAHSLWLERNAPLKLHLQRAGSESKLSLAVRGFSTQSGGSYFNKTARAGVVGGSKVVQIQANFSGAASIATGDTTYPWATSAQTFEALLDEPGTDVLLNIADVYCGGGPCPPSGGWLIDDVKLE